MSEWKLVPVEPTLDMLHAAVEHHNAHEDEPGWGGLYRAMIAAAPPAPSAEPGESVEFYNPWRESLENCISGDNYLRASEYRSLIEELDDLYQLRAAHPAPAAPPAPSAEPTVPASSVDWLLLKCEEYQRRAHDAEREVLALRAQIEQIGGGR